MTYFNHVTDFELFVSQGLGQLFFFAREGLPYTYIVCCVTH